MKKRILSIALCFCVALGLLPTAARAEDTISDGLTITGTDGGYDYTSDSGRLYIIDDGTYAISGTTTADTVYVEPGITADITLQDVNIDASSQSYSAFAIGGDATVNLTLACDNVLTSAGGHAGLKVPDGATLNITSASTGTLTATGAGSGAGIGGDCYDSCGAISICGGNVKAAGAEAIGSRGTLTGVGGVVLNRTPTIVTLDDVTDTGVTVTNLTVRDREGNPYAYGSTTQTLAGGKLYLWLPDGAAVTSVTAGGKQYGGSVTAGDTGTLGLAAAGVITSDGKTIGYADFASALSAAQASSGSTLTLLADATTNNSTQTDINTPMTLDLNGHTWDMGGHGILIDTSGDLTVKDSSVGKTGLLTSRTDTLDVSAGELTVNGGTIETTGGTALLCCSDVIVNGGTFCSGGGCAVDFQCGTLTVNGGTIDDGLEAEQPGVNLKGGTFDFISVPSGMTANSLLADGCRYYDTSGNTVDGSGQAISRTVTVERDWSGDVTYDSGSGTYTVLSAEGLRWISAVANGTITGDTYQTDPAVPSADFSGCTVSLGADIDLSGVDWTPIAGSDGFFDGTFDGAGHRISNMHVNLTGIDNFYAGLFRGLSDGGSVRNLSVGGSVKVTGGTAYVGAGGIAGHLSVDSGNASVENCVSNVAVSVIGGAKEVYAGGIVGSIDVSQGEASVENCVSNVAVSVGGGAGKVFAGGMIGIAQNCSHASVSLKNCRASGTVSVVGGAEWVFAGGITGSLFVQGEASVENCASDVAVSVDGDVNMIFAGGMSGAAGGGGNESLSLKNCCASGTATSSRTNSYCGGIFGLVDKDETAFLQNCYAATAPVGKLNPGSGITADSVGTYDPSTGALTAANGSTLHYGTTLSNAMKYWIYRHADADIPSYLTWTTDSIPTLTTVYTAVVTPHTYSNWTRSGDTYIRTDNYTGLSHAAAVTMTDGGTVSPYGTLADAIAAAQSKRGSTVTLQTDVTTDAEADVASGTFTIDLNGKTWTGSPTGAAECALRVKGGNVTLKDSGTNGTFTGTRNTLNDACCTLYAESGIVNVESGIYQCASDQGSALFVGANAAVTLSGGTFTSLQTTDRSVGDLLVGGCVYRSTESGNALVSDVSVKKLANVTVQAPVKITAQPQGATVTCGYTDAPTLRVTAVTVPADSGKTVSYQWYQNGTAITDATSADVTVPIGFAVGYHSYYCAVTCDGYTVNSAAATVTVTGSSSGGSSSGSTNMARISSGTDQISTSFSVLGGTMTVSVTDAQAKELASDAKTAGTIRIDVSGQNIDAIVVPSKIISAADDAKLEVALPTGTVMLDKSALASVASKGDVKLSVEIVENSKLTNSQKSVLGSQAGSATVVDVNVYAGGSRVSTIGDGKITVSVPYTLKPGENADSITVWFLNDDGTIEPKTASYANGKVTFTTEHLSQYLIVDFPFTDVDASAWCYGSVAYTYNNGLFSGTSATTFSPNATTNRQMIWMVLARMDGKMPANMAEAKAWAVENGISDGSNPTGTITRQQLAAILYRYAQFKGYDVSVGEDTNILSYGDALTISEYAIPALQWVCGAGLMQGSGNNLMPFGNATRAQVATVLQRFSQNTVK